jgi:hypothetical protein
MRKEMREIWIATDGEEFISQEQCEEYETELCVNEEIRTSYFSAEENRCGLFNHKDLKQFVRKNPAVFVALLKKMGWIVTKGE